MNLEIGGGKLLRAGWVNLDPAHGTGPWRRLAQDTPWPTGDHSVCPKGDGHDWYKPHPRPADHKYQCLQCGHYDLDDYK